MPAAAATFGSVVVIGGHASDLALDERRAQLYVANFGGRRVDVMSTTDNKLRRAIPVPGEPGALALDPTNRYLLVTNYDNCPPTPPPTFACDFLSSPTTPQLTVIDLDANVQQTYPIPLVTPVAPPPLPAVCAPAPVPVTPPTTPPNPPPPPPPSNAPLAIAFGAGNKALLVTSNGIFLVDPTVSPAVFTQLPFPQLKLTSMPLPAQFATFPPQILQASTGVSGDGQTIVVLAQASAAQFVFRYNVSSGALSAIYIGSTPALGPRVVSVDGDGSNVIAGWALLNRDNVLLAQFPYPTGLLNLGGHAYDYQRNAIYAQIPTGPATDPPVLHILDTDNLTVRERIRLPENLAGRSLFRSDMKTLYAISDSGVTVLPIGSLTSAHRVAAQEEQLLFQATNCDNQPITQTLHIRDLGAGGVDFSLSVPTGTQGVRLGQVSGTTPADITIQIDPTAYRSQTGTSVVPVTIQSNGSIGIPSQIRLLINTKEPDQRGIIHSLPGKIVDLMQDPVRGRLYAIRQDRNQVMVLDGAKIAPVAILRTGNTPTQMAVTRDNRFLIVGNDNSQIANVFDLETLQPTQFIRFPFGHYPRSIAASNSSMFALVRNAGAPPGLVDQIDFANRVATTPCSLGIYYNNPPADSIMTSSPSGGSIFTAMSDGTVLLYDDAYDSFEASRKDSPSLAGSYAAISDDTFLAGGILFNRSLVQMGQVIGTTSDSSILTYGDQALTASAASPSAASLVQRVAMDGSGILQPTRAIEAPVTKTFLTTPPAGQIGQTVLSFLRTMVPAGNGGTAYLSISGITELPAGFDQPTPIPVVSSVTNIADGGQVAPGSLMTIAGSGFSSASAAADGLPLPTSLAEMCASINNVPVPLIRVSPDHVDAQLPYEVVGSANLVITSPGGKSAPFHFNAPATAAAVFQTGQAGDLSGLPLIYRAANNQLVDVSNPVHPDDVLLIIATGLGATSPSATSGAAAPSDPLEIVSAQPTVTLGGTPLGVAFAGLVPGQVGIYQINAVVPHGIRAATNVPLLVQQGTNSTTFSVRVVNP